MSYKQLYIFVEGSDDERYIDKVIRPILLSNYSNIKVIKYATLLKVTVEKFINTYRNQDSSDYLFFCDMDARGDKSYCISKRKEKVQNKYGNCIEIERIIVVKEEIESWYLAGIIESNLSKFKISPFTDTQSITKEEFERMRPKNYGSSIDFMVEILKEYSLEQAKILNSSIKYFVSKHVKVE